MSVTLTPDISNFLFFSIVVISLSTGVVAAAVRWAGSLRDLITG